MTVTTIYLQGVIEPFDETVRHWIARNWLKANTLGVTPSFTSPNGIDKKQADYSDDVTKNDMESMQVDGLIVFEATEQTLVGGGRGKSGKTMNTVINITIYGLDRQHLFFFMQEFNRIMEGRPHTGQRIKKSNNTEDSAIAYFDRDQMDWARPQTIDTSTHVVITSGQLGVRWMISET